jgi:PPOX class probable F420-dependent enzyme
MMDDGPAWRRLKEARIGRLATADPGGLPHVVPVVFAVSGRTLYWAVDHKPKRSRRLKRLDNIRANPNVEVVVDHYEDDWDRLWWVRATGTARVVVDGDERRHALEALAHKYEQYRQSAPEGTVVAIDVTRVTSWVGAPSDVG